VSALAAHREVWPVQARSLFVPADQIESACAPHRAVSNSGIPLAREHLGR
jgi:hypothetical protein